MTILKVLIFIIFIACVILLAMDFNNSPKVRDGVAELFVGAIIVELIVDHFKKVV